MRTQRECPAGAVCVYPHAGWNNNAAALLVGVSMSGAMAARLRTSLRGNTCLRQWTDAPVLPTVGALHFGRNYTKGCSLTSVGSRYR